MKTTKQDVQDLELSVTIAARRETVFQFFSDPVRWQSWMGSVSSIRPGKDGEVIVRSTHCTTTSGGKILEWVENERVAFVWDHDSGPLAGVPTQVTITLAAVPGGTRVTLVHAGLPTEKDRAEHAGGWRHYLGQISLVAAREAMQGRLDKLTDVWARAWGEADDARRAELLAQCWAQDGRFRDAYGCTDDRDALCAHIGNAIRMTQGAKVERVGAVEQCHSFVRWSWRCTMLDGTPLASGTNVGELDGEGRLRSLVGFWG